MKKTCPYCHAKVPVEASFCPFCAKSIKPKVLQNVPKHTSKKVLCTATLIAGFVLVSTVLLLPPSLWRYDDIAEVINPIQDTSKPIARPSAPAPPPTASVLSETAASQKSEDNIFVPHTDDYTAVYVQEDEDGYVRISPDEIRQYIPESNTSYISETSYLGSDLEDYIKYSYSFSDLISRGIDNGISGEGNRLHTISSNICLLVFQWKDNRPYLIGYFIGKMEPSGASRWCLKVTPCNYDLTTLYRQEQEKYSREKQTWVNGLGLLANYIAPEDVFESGAAYFIKGYNTGLNADMLWDDCQMYHLWFSYQSPYRNKIAKEISQYGHYASNVREDRYQCFLLLDENYEQIGYTVIKGGD